MTALTPYITWIQEEVKKKRYGDVAIRFCIHNGQITLVKKESTETEKVR
jgi:hypothetical protein